MRAKRLWLCEWFYSQTTPEIRDSCYAYNICVSYVPANMNKYYQPLDLTVNLEAKCILKRKFVDWYSYQISNQLSEGKPLESVQGPLKLSIIKHIHADWLAEFFNYTTSVERKKYIHSRWRNSGITDAVQMGEASLLPIEPFNDLDIFFPLTQETQEFDSVIDIPEEQNGFRCSSNDEYDKSRYDDSE